MSDDTGVAMRYERIAYLNIGTKNASGTYDASGVDFRLMGDGFESLDDSLNPNVDETQYISDTAASKTITGYAPEWSFDGSVIKDSDVIDFIRDIGKNLSTGSDSECEIVMYDVWDLSGSTVAAQKYICAVKVDSIGSGSGGEKLKFSGSILGKGDPVDGTFDTSALTFTAS